MHMPNEGEKKVMPQRHLHLSSLCQAVEYTLGLRGIIEGATDRHATDLAVKVP